MKGIKADLGSKFTIFLIVLFGVMFLSCVVQTQQVEPYSGEIEDLFKNAEENFDRQRFNQAAFEYNSFLQQYPADTRYPDALYRLGYIQVVHAKYDSASTLFGRLLVEFPDSRWRFLASTWSKVLEDLLKAEAKTITQKVYIEREGTNTDELLENCEDEIRELRSRIKKLESIIEGGP